MRNKLYKNIVVIGVGSLGSELVYSLTLRELFYKDNINKLYIIDDDSLSIKNLPYITLFNGNNDYIGKPKVNVCHTLLYNINSNISILPYNMNYNDFKLKHYNDLTKDTYIIDCRDCSEIDSTIDLKLNIDGIYGKILFNDNKINKDYCKGKYNFGNSKYYARAFSCYIIELLYNNDILNYNEYIVNLLSKEITVLDYNNDNN